MPNVRATLLAATLLLPAAAQAADYGAFLDAQFAASQGLVDMAAGRMIMALRADPSSAQLQSDAFALALLAGRPDAATYAADVPDNPAAELLLADVKGLNGDWQGAELGYAELPQQGPVEALRPMLLAWAQQAQGHTDRALATLQPGINGSHMQGVYLLEAALIADASHRDGLAQRLFDLLIKAESQPNLQFMLIVSNWQARAGNMDQARKTIDDAVHAAPELAIAEPRLLTTLEHPKPFDARFGIAHAYASEAAELRAQNAPDFASLLTQLAIGMDPDLTIAHLIAAELDMVRKQPTEAADELAKVSPEDPLAPVVQLRMAGLYDRAGNIARAEAMLRKLAAAYPGQPTPLVQLGDLLSEEKKFSEAVNFYDQAIALDRHPSSSDWVLFYSRGAALERQHEWARAVGDMNRALELSPDQPFVLNFLGFAWADRNENLPEARTMIERALKQRPNDGAIIDSLGWVQLRQGDAAHAVRTLEHAAELEPEDPTITGHLGDAYWQLGRHIEAEDQWRRALVLKPDPDDAARIASRLKSASK
jgi:tetratricopeptide (TPR) repeat protein